MARMKKVDLKDYALLANVGAILLVGIIIMASVSTVYSQEIFGTPYHFLFRHFLHIIVGIFAGYILYKIRLDLIKRWSTFIMIANIILLAMVFIPGLGFSWGGATRWIDLGFFMLQPAEFLKLSFIIFFSAWLVKINDLSLTKRKKEKIKSNKIYPILICATFFIISAVLLLLQPNISNLVILLAIAIIIYFFSGITIWQSLIMLTGGIAGIALIIKIFPYAIDRVLVFLNPGLDPMGIGYQIKQISIAIGSGGLFGVGLGMSRQKMGFLPETIGDSIFAVLAEETGFFGSLFLVLLFVVFLWLGFKISMNAVDKFSSLVAVGITSWIIIQAFVNISAMLGIFPLTGIPLPFISYGGSHLLAELAAIGLLLNIAKNKKQNLGN